MNMRSGLMLLITASVLLGCRQPDPTIDLLEAELRFMEDQMYLMEDEHEKASAKLASCRRENSTLRKDNAEGDASSTIPNSASGPADDLDIDIENLAPPTVEEGEEIEPQIEFPQPAKLPLDINIRPASKTEPVDKPVDARVTHIVFNSRLTGGVDLNGRPGDEGLMLVVEPRNADGQYVSLPGEVSIVVLDRSKTGQDARVARWDYESVETARFLRKTLFGRGIHLELPWPNQPPESERLDVHVRYTTVDGRKLEAQREVQVDPLDPAAGQWTPASTPFAAHAGVSEPPVRPIPVRV